MALATATTRPETSAPGDVRTLASSFRRSVRARNLSPRTEKTYLEAVSLMADFLVAHGMPTEVHAIAREHVEAFLADQLGSRRPSTVAIRYRSLQQFWRWCEEEGEVTSSPMTRMSPPKVPEDPPPVLSSEDMEALFVACKGSDFEDRRDLAIIRLLDATGMRRGEVAGLLVEDIDLDLAVAIVLGKGRRRRACPFGRQTALAMDRYLRLRSRHRFGHRPELWLGERGALTDSGISQIVRRRVGQAGLPDRVHLHMFRHSAAHRWLSEGGNEGDLMRLMGWSSRQMLSRYGASAADQRAREAYQRLLGDKL